jgi:hypothetical protein
MMMKSFSLSVFLANCSDIMAGLYFSDIAL